MNRRCFARSIIIIAFSFPRVSLKGWTCYALGSCRFCKGPSPGRRGTCFTVCRPVAPIFPYGTYDKYCSIRRNTCERSRARSLNQPQPWECTSTSVRYTGIGLLPQHANEKPETIVSQVHRGRS
ncbi:hypothetical protein BJV78DRAFT_226521 [Lactifluus subvellereus]|nr:hypothetical protein BJV78DRAFT_226521 [Lactifluus subvellereus]